MKHDMIEFLPICGRLEDTMSGFVRQFLNSNVTSGSNQENSLLGTRLSRIVVLAVLRVFPWEQWTIDGLIGCKQIKP